MGLIYMNNAMFSEAIAEFEKATKYKTSIVEGVNSYKALYNKGVILECLGNISEAVKNYEAAAIFCMPKKDFLLLERVFYEKNICNYSLL